MIDLLDMLRGYGVDGIIQKGEELMFCCPFHADKTPSCSLNTREGYFHCFGCGEKGTVADFIARIEHISPEEAKKKVDAPTVIPKQQVIDKVLSILREAPVVTKEPIDEKCLQDFKFIHKSTVDRVGGNTDVLKEFGVGFSNEHNRTTLPIRDEKGVLVGVVGRAVGDARPKYKPVIPVKGFEKSNHLYGLYLCTRPTLMLAICEGEFDVINAFRFGFRFFVGLLGSSLSESQRQLLVKNTNHVILALDNDEAGKAGAEKIIKQLRGQVKLSLFQYPTRECKDIGDLTQEEIYNGVGNMKDILI